MLVGHDDVAEGRISRLGFVGNSTSGGGGGRRVEGRNWLAVLHLVLLLACVIEE